jgi:tRNA A37 methylthiotransferase MiaB
MPRADTETAKNRSRAAAALAQRIARKNAQKCVGRTFSALMLGTYRDFYTGRTDAYRSVFARTAPPDEFVHVRAVSATPTHLHAIYLNKEDIT